MLPVPGQGKHPSHKLALASACLLTATISAVVSLLPAQPVAANFDNPENGRHLYGFYGCVDCHGVNGEGDAAPRIAGYSDVFEAFLQQLRTPRELMDPYSADFLSDDQASDIYSYLKTLP